VTLGNPVKGAQGRIAQINGHVSSLAVEGAANEAQVAAAGDSLAGGLEALDDCHMATILCQGIASTDDLIFFAFFMSASMSSSCTHTGGSLACCSYFWSILIGISGMSRAHCDWLSPCVRRMAMSVCPSVSVVVGLVMIWRLCSDGG